MSIAPKALSATFYEEVKYVIVHEMGHALLKKAKGQNQSGSDLNLLEAGHDCPQGPGHLMNSKEYLPAAIWEGFAHYYAAVIWNRDSEEDCRFQYYKDLDWSLDTVVDWTDSTHNYIDCEHGLHDGAITVSNWDYYGNGPGHGPTCEGPIDAYRGTPYDWLRFFWDLTTQQDTGINGLSFTQVVNLLVEAEVGHGWDNTSDADWTAVYCSGITYCDQHVPAWCQTYPSYRLTNAAFCQGHEDEWEYALRGPEANDVDR